MKRSLLYPQFAGILLLLMLVSLHVNAANQLAHHKVRVEIPEILKMEMGSGEIAFDLARSKPEEPFPATGYPVYYTPTSTGQYIPVRVFSNGGKEWRLLISGLDEQGLTEGAIEWSLDGVNWRPLRVTEQVLTTGGFTNGWLELKVYFRLAFQDFTEIRPGQYRVQVNYQLSSV
ncbi:MAG: hypothetical protein GX202_03980 [Firmicutes bacterium]|nr:hypothetical protein [Bacillota bacterium]